MSANSGPSHTRATDSTHQAERQSSAGVKWGFAIGLSLLTGNWIAAVARFQANGLFWDQWGLHLAQIWDLGWWSIFHWQHGPHRQGVGGVLTAVVMAAAEGDTRMESLWIVGQLVGAAILAMALVARVKGRLHWVDLWIPLSVLTLSQYETLILVPNGSHSVTPLLLVMAGAHCWLTANPAVRWGGLAMVGSLLIFTGFGIIAALVLTLLVGWQVVRANTFVPSRQERFARAAFIFGIILVWALFLHDYVFEPAHDQFSLLHQPVFDYVKFGISMAASMGGMEEVNGISYILGSGILIFVVILLIRTWRQTPDGNRPSRPSKQVALWLLLTGLGFIGFTTYGRVDLGVATAGASRYLTLTWLMMFGAYLLATQVRSAQWMRVAAGIGWMVALGPWLHLWERPLSDWRGTMGMRDGDLANLRTTMQQKVAWQHALIEKNDWRYAEERVPQGVFPYPESFGFDELLPQIEQRGFSYRTGKTDDLAWLPWAMDHPVQWLHPLRGRGWRHATAGARVLLRNSEAGFVNLRFETKANGSPDWQWGWGERYGDSGDPVGKNGISVPVSIGNRVLRIDGDVRLQTPTVSPHPQYPTWHWNGDAWRADRLLKISHGFHGWEENGKFGWTEAVLQGEVLAPRPSFLNIWIEGRFTPVDSNDVEVTLGQRRTLLQLPKGKGTEFSIRVPESEERLRLSIRNVTGATSPQAEGLWDDRRELALRLRRLSLDEQAAFGEIELSPIRD